MISESILAEKYKLWVEFLVHKSDFGLKEGEEEAKSLQVFPAEGLRRVREGQGGVRNRAGTVGAKAQGRL